MKKTGCNESLKIKKTDNQTINIQLKFFGVLWFVNSN
ncbi:hypothetical protein CLV48_11322 [Cecembia rubra]|uniref:Uncharacterized protein n=1 Tax=Cecembia rubra TaxID=1485585 RepID=A0A2P8DW31_9BACT|nr:hypothetical protein CLV48_11322 [Cecembia rubra]